MNTRCEVIYGVTVFKNDVLDRKHTKKCSSSEEAASEYEKLKNKYNAEDIIPEGKRRFQLDNCYITFAFANGKCKHGKKIEVSYDEYTDITKPVLTLK